jgi:hypothetical protein
MARRRARLYSPDSGAGSGRDTAMIFEALFPLRDRRGFERTSRRLSEWRRGLPRLLRAGDGFQPVRKIDGANKRVYVVAASIFDGGGNEV